MELLFQYTRPITKLDNNTDYCYLRDSVKTISMHQSVTHTLKKFWLKWVERMQFCDSLPKDGVNMKIYNLDALLSDCN